MHRERKTTSLTILRWAHGGDGVAFLADGRICFVPGVVPGDVVRVRLTDDKPRFARAVVEALEVASPARVVPACDVQARCGGCPWMIGSPAAQAASREAILRGEVKKRLGDVPVEMAAASAPLGYRQRVRLTIRGGRVGYIAKGTHTHVPITRCPITVPAIDGLIPALGDRARDWPDGRVTLLAGDEGVAGWVQPDVGAGFGWGLDHVTVLGQVMSARAFAQANGAVTRAIMGELAELFGPSDGASGGVAVELFAGSGTLTQVLWEHGWEVHAYELDGAARPAFEAARAASHGRGTWHACDLSTGLVTPAPPRADAVLLDPPRTGAAEIMPWVRATSTTMVVYVSCDLATGLRDLAMLCADGRWRVERVTGYDMFPHSGHQELVAVARRVAMG